MQFVDIEMVLFYTTTT